MYKDIDELKEQVYLANLMLPKHNLVTFTWGNVSGIDREKNIMVIKPSGVEYDEMRASDMVCVDIPTGNTVESKLKPSSDTPTHLELYRNFPNIGGITHTHSRWATIFAQMRENIRPFGTTHADYFRGEIPCTRLLKEEEINSDYELETGKVIAETFYNRNPGEIPAVLVANHGPFTWGKDPLNSAHNAVVLEELAFMAWHGIMLKGDLPEMQKALLDKHYLRKHGAKAYYGQ